MGIKHAGYRMICDKCNYDKGLIYEADNEDDALNSAIKESLKSGWKLNRKTGDWFCCSCNQPNKIK